jgi:tRNA(adenine34) deaminase
MQAALRLALAASVREEVPIGAVIIAEGEVLGEAHNETVQRRDPTAHAELLALQRALSKAGEDRLPFATLYVTLEPCAQCAGAMVLAKVGRVVFGAYDSRVGGGRLGGATAPASADESPPEVIGGLMAEGSASPQAVLPEQREPLQTL